jgi:hypothetical protein
MDLTTTTIKPSLHNALKAESRYTPMHLFDKLPESLFSILASRNRRVYVDALFVLHDCFKQNLAIRREDLVSMLIGRLEDELLEDLDPLEDEGMTESQSISGKANFLIRKMNETGWIDIEFRSDTFEEVVSLPDYAVQLIVLLYELTHEEKREYNGYVVSTYTNLRAADQDRDDYAFEMLEQARRNTEKLVDLLKSLYNNIIRYHNQLFKTSGINEILKLHFDDFMDLVHDRIYHPLKTLDSVPRFRQPICEILNRWMNDETMKDLLIRQAIQRRRFESEHDAVDGILQMMTDITNTYDGLEEILRQIERKNAVYTQAAFEKVRYLVTRDHSIRGKLASVISGLRHVDEETLDAVSALGTELYAQRYIDEQSLYKRTIKKKSDFKAPLKVRKMGEDEKAEGLKSFVSGLDREYSVEKLEAFIQTLLGDKHEISTQEIEINEDEVFTKLVAATMKSSDPLVSYRVEFGEKKQHRSHRYRVPDMRLIRKGKPYVD